MNGQQNQRRGGFSVISTGTTSIVLIFVMLCMLTFSVLSLVSAQANLRLSERSAARTTSYYEAENAANDILLALIAVLEETPLPDLAPGTPNPVPLRPQARAAWLEAVRAAVAAQPALAGVTIDTAAGTAVWQVPLGEAQQLAVRLALYEEPRENGRQYSILTWQAVSDYDWQQGTLDVLKVE